MINIDDRTDVIFPYLSNTIDESRTVLFVENIQFLYSKFQDDVSKKMFLERLLICFTQNNVHIRKLSELTHTGAAFCERIKQLFVDHHQIYIYGCGKRGKRLVDMFPDIQFAGFIDRNIECGYKNIPILSIDKVPSECGIVVSNLYAQDVIVNDLLSQGIKEDSIVVLTEYEKEIQKEIYLETRCIQAFRNLTGTFIDGGALDGNDCKRFVNSNFYNGNSIIAFEPDYTSYIHTTENLKGINHLTVYQKGLSDRTESVRFDGGKGEAARISEDGEDIIQTVRIDDICTDERVSFIKLDIEGSEFAAITGAKNTIIRDKPNMMVSVYHKKEDILAIPLLLLKYNKRYRFALGHYSVGSASDTVLYAFE